MYIKARAESHDDQYLKTSVLKFYKMAASKKSYMLSERNIGNM